MKNIYKEELMDQSAFFKLNYGLYIVSSASEGKHAGCVVNTVQQVTAIPEKLSVTLNKENATLEMIQKSNVFNVVVLCEDVDMDTIRTFGFQSSHDIDKYKELAHAKDEFQIPYLTQHVAARFTCKVLSSLDLDTHILFAGEVCSCEVLSEETAMTYGYYHKVKKGTTPPKASSYQPDTKQSGYRCTVCGYIYEGEPLPVDFVCPICHQPASVFEKI